MTEETLLERARRRRQELGYVSEDGEQPSTKPEYDADLIPDIPHVQHGPDDLSPHLDGLDILDVYQRWCGKSHPEPGNRREGIMISCPNPDHPDAHPSAWINLDKQTYYCGACDMGGDKYDIAAMHFGVDYRRDPKQFPDLRKRMAQDLGVVITRTISGQEIASQPAPAPEPKPIKPETSPPLAVVKPMPTVEAAFQWHGPQVDWQSILPEDTFWHKYVETCSEDDLPNEYFFWTGGALVGFAGGDDVILADNPPVKSNLFLCLFGPTGIGKSRGTSYALRLLRMALPYDPDDPTSKGVSLMASPGSPEAMVDSFSKPEYDPSDPKKIVGYHSVRGLLRFDELSTLIGRSQRIGNPIKPTLMELYDGYESVEIRSRGAGYVRAENPFCSCITTTQPRAIRDLLVQSDTDSGFVNRWIFAVGPTGPLSAYGRQRIDMNPLVLPLQDLRGWCGRKRDIHLGGKALERWEDFFYSEIQPIKFSDEYPLMTRIDLHLKKLILLFCINERKDAPSVDLVDRVLKLAPYLKASYTTLASEIGIGPFQEFRGVVAELVQKLEAQLGKPPTARDISRFLPSRYPRDMLVKVVQTMTLLGELEELTVNSGRGRPSIRYRFSA